MYKMLLIFFVCELKKCIIMGVLIRIVYFVYKINLLIYI